MVSATPSSRNWAKQSFCRFACIRTVAALGTDSDLDGDGVSDSAEFVAGTDALDEGSGPPAKLFVHNLRGNAFNLIMMILATALGIYGLNAVLHGFDQAMRARRESQEEI